MNSRPVRWQTATFKQKECDADRCKVLVDVTYTVSMPGAVTTPVTSTSTQSETWILVNGDWYFLPK